MYIEFEDYPMNSYGFTDFNLMRPPRTACIDFAHKSIVWSLVYKSAKKTSALNMTCYYEIVVIYFYHTLLTNPPPPPTYSPPPPKYHH